MPTAPQLPGSTDIDRRIGVLFGFLSNLFGADNLVLKGRKMGILKLMQSARTADRILAIQRLVFDDPTFRDPPSKDRYAEALDAVEDEIANLAAQRTVEEDMEQRIAAKMRDRHLDYVKELRREALKEEQGPENAATLKRLADLDDMENRGLGVSIQALLARIGTPYPQHVILYGPPGVGKTTVARLVLERIKQAGSVPFASEAPFVEVDATTVRWDPREITNPLLGSVTWRRTAFPSPSWVWSPRPTVGCFSWMRSANSTRSS